MVRDKKKVRQKEGVINKAKDIEEQKKSKYQRAQLKTKETKLRTNLTLTESNLSFLDGMCDSYGISRSALVDLIIKKMKTDEFNVFNF